MRREAQQAYDAQLQGALTDTVWNAGGCRSWYRDEHGRNFTLWPTHTSTFIRQMRRFDAEAHDLRRVAGDVPPGPGQLDAVPAGCAAPDGAEHGAEVLLGRARRSARATPRVS